jgi:CubicO group peptidase (beta-lactamase class C family)
MKRTFDDVPKLLARVAEDHVVPGLAVAAMVDGELACVATHGYRDEKAGRPMTAETPSRWYSISKPITALALAQLVAKGKLRWDQPLSQLVPGAVFADPVATADADVRDCLLHRTGLHSGNWTWWKAPTDPAELMKRLPHLPCSAGFRVGHQYQNINFTILGEVFQACGTTWHQAVRDLLGPLGIRPLTRLSEFVSADRMIGYGPNGFAPAEQAEDFDFEAVAAASAVCGTVVELAQLGGAVADGGRGMLPSGLWAEVMRPQLAMPAYEWSEMQQPSLVLAGRMLVYRGERVIHWAGGWVGYGSHLLVMPSRRVAVAVLTNRTATNATDLLAFSMLDRAAGMEPAPWADRFLEQKRRFRRSAQERYAARLNRERGSWPCPAGLMAGRFWHPGYGELVVRSSGDGLRLEFRGGVLEMTPRADGTVSAEEGRGDCAETSWDLKPVISDGRGVAWDFNPDTPAAPCRFMAV